MLWCARTLIAPPPAPPMPGIAWPRPPPPPLRRKVIKTLVSMFSGNAFTLSTNVFRASAPAPPTNEPTENSGMSVVNISVTSMTGALSLP